MSTSLFRCDSGGRQGLACGHENLGASQLGADEYWTKPLAPDRFLADVARLMGEAAADPRVMPA
jgi:hypothetical protein